MIEAAVIGLRIRDNKLVWSLIGRNYLDVRLAQPTGIHHGDELIE